MDSLSQKQTELFQLTNRYRLPSTFKNDAVGIWYDAKSAVAQSISKLKTFVEEKGTSLLAQAFQPTQLANAASSATEMSGDQLSQSNPTGKEEFTKLIERFEEDMVALKRGNKDFDRTIAKLRSQIKQADETILQDKLNVKQSHNELADAIVSTNDILLGRVGL